MMGVLLTILAVAGFVGVAYAHARITYRYRRDEIAHATAVFEGDLYQRPFGAPMDGIAAG